LLHIDPEKIDTLVQFDRSERPWTAQGRARARPSTGDAEPGEALSQRTARSKKAIRFNNVLRRPRSLRASLKG
jgi:hypothetical protein